VQEFDFEVDDSELLDTDLWRSGLSADVWLDTYDLTRMRWSVGRISRLSRRDATLYITPMTAHSPIQVVTCDSMEIAPFLSHAKHLPSTASAPWRSQWAVGSKIDILDQRRKWWNGEVVAVIPASASTSASSKAGGSPAPSASDKLKVRYDGWSERWDEVLPRSSLRLAPYQRYAPSVYLSLTATALPLLFATLTSPLAAPCHPDFTARPANWTTI
jgi:hypothetical protein